MSLQDEWDETEAKRDCWLCRDPELREFLITKRQAGVGHVRLLRFVRAKGFPGQRNKLQTCLERHP